MIDIYDFDDLKEYGKVYEEDTIHTLFEDNKGIKIVSQTVHRQSPFTQYILLDNDSKTVSRRLTLTNCIKDYITKYHSKL